VLLIFYLLFLLGAVAVGYALPSGLLRLVLFGGTVAVAILCLGIQLLLGFPFASTQPHEVTMMQHQLDGRPRFDHKTGKWEESDKVRLQAQQLPWAHLAWPVLLAALAVAGFDLVVVATAKAKPRRRTDDREDDRARKQRVRRDDGRERRRDRDDEEDNERDRPPRSRRRRE
jgi:hypothetical protein